MGYRGIPCNRVEYRSVGKVIAYTGISWSVEQFSGIIWSTMISWFVCLGSSLTILEYHGISRGIIEHNENSCNGLPWKLVEYNAEILRNIMEWRMS